MTTLEIFQKVRSHYESICAGNVYCSDKCEYYNDCSFAALSENEWNSIESIFKAYDRMHKTELNKQYGKTIQSG